MWFFISPLYLVHTGRYISFRFKDGFKSVESSTGETFDFTAVNFTRKTSDDHYQEMCSALGSGEFSTVVDMAWGGWIKGRKTAAELGLPYIRVEAANHLFVQAADDFLRSQNATDAALIFEDQVRTPKGLSGLGAVMMFIDRKPISLISD